MWFIISFIVAAGAAWAYARFEPVSEELAILCVGITLTCVLLTLISAPWPIQLAMVAALLTTQWVQQNGLFN